MPSVVELRAEVIRLKESGLSFNQIGDTLGFSRQRAHQLFHSPPPDPATSNGASSKTSRGSSRGPSRPLSSLTVKERKFVSGLVQGKNQTQAAIDAGAAPRSAHVWASNAIRRPNVKESFEELLDRQGLSEERLAEIHAENLRATKVVAVARNNRGEITEVRTAPDHATRQRAVADGWRVRGRLGMFADQEEADRRPINIYLNPKTVEKVERLVGRKIIDVKSQPVEDGQPEGQPSLPEAREPEAPSSSSPGDVLADPPAAEHAAAEVQESRDEEPAEDLASLIGAEW